MELEQFAGHARDLPVNHCADTMFNIGRFEECIRVQNEQELSNGNLESLIYGAGEPLIARIADHADWSGKVPVERHVCSPVIDDDHFDLWMGLGGKGFETTNEHIRFSQIWNDRTHQPRDHRLVKISARARGGYTCRMIGQRILVTGGAGFLGSHFVRLALESGAAKVTNVDVLTYAGDVRRLSDLEGDSRYEFIQADVTSQSDISRIVGERGPDAIVHYAAESHVTRSENQSDLFHQTNTEGTRVMLDAAVAAGVKRFLHISTDEVYGSILTGSFREEDKIPGAGAATSPYAQSKALADDLALTYASQLRVVVARPTNAFGPWQFPEKAFPRWATRALNGDTLPVWGDGLYVRQWLYAGDFARAIALLLSEGASGEAYNVGPRHDPEITNIELAKWLVKHYGLPQDRIEMTAYDRPDHDRRYSVDSSKIEALGWSAGDVFEQFALSADWYRDHKDWWESHLAVAEAPYMQA